MGSLNKVFLMGNLTRDPEIRYGQSGVAITRVGLAINRRVRDRESDQWRDEVDFINVKFFGKRGEAVSQYMRKGSPILIEGQLRYNSWETPQGERRGGIEVIGDSFEFVGPKGGGGGGDYQSGGGGGDYQSGGGGGGGYQQSGGGYQQDSESKPGGQSGYSQSPPAQQPSSPPQDSAPPPPPKDLPPYDESAFADDDVPF